MSTASWRAVTNSQRPPPRHLETVLPQRMSQVNQVRRCPHTQAGTSRCSSTAERLFGFWGCGAVVGVAAVNPMQLNYQHDLSTPRSMAGQHQCVSNSSAHHVSSFTPLPLNASLTHCVCPCPATVGRMQQSVDRVANKLVEIEGAQRYHYFRERRHRDTAESSNTRAMWCSIVEALALCLGTGINIYIVQTWFATPVKRSQV